MKKHSTIQTLYDRFNGNNNVAIILVSNDNVQKVQKFMKDKGYTMPVYIGRSTVPVSLSSRAIPTSFLITPTGKIVMKETGAHNWGGDKMAEIIKGLL